MPYQSALTDNLISTWFRVVVFYSYTLRVLVMCLLQIGQLLLKCRLLYIYKTPSLFSLTWHIPCFTCVCNRFVSVMSCLVISKRQLLPRLERSYIKMALVCVGWTRVWRPQWLATECLIWSTSASITTWSSSFLNTRFASFTLQFCFDTSLTDIGMW